MPFMLNLKILASHTRTIIYAEAFPSKAKLNRTGSYTTIIMQIFLNSA